MIPFHQIRNSRILTRLLVLLNRSQTSTLMFSSIVFIIVRPKKASEDRDIQLAKIPIRHINYPSTLLPPLNATTTFGEVRHLKPEYVYAILPTRGLLHLKEYRQIVSSPERWYAHIEAIKAKTYTQEQKTMLDRFRDAFIPLKKEEFPLTMRQLEEILSRHHVEQVLKYEL